jgi:outer membrane protein OmpA-like peptidoglycan-associated protein
LALILFLTRNRDDRDTRETASTTSYNSTSENAGRDADWKNINFTAPAVAHSEISDREVEVRGTDNYSIYGLGADVLFDKGKATLRSGAEASLRQISQSINQRYQNGVVRIYGFTDNDGQAQENMQLSLQRADAVKNWLQQNGNITADRISVHPMGEQRPQANNTTEQGKQQNRRVEIVARRAQ